MQNNSIISTHCSLVAAATSSWFVYFNPDTPLLDPILSRPLVSRAARLEQQVPLEIAGVVDASISDDSYKLVYFRFKVPWTVATVQQSASPLPLSNYFPSGYSEAHPEATDYFGCSVMASGLSRFMVDIGRLSGTAERESSHKSAFEVLVSSNFATARS